MTARELRIIDAQDNDPGVQALRRLVRAAEIALVDRSRAIAAEQGGRDGSEWRREMATALKEVETCVREVRAMDAEKALRRVG